MFRGIINTHIRFLELAVSRLLPSIYYDAAVIVVQSSFFFLGYHVDVNFLVAALHLHSQGCTYRCGNGVAQPGCSGLRRFFPICNCDRALALQGRCQITYHGNGRIADHGYTALSATLSMLALCDHLPLTCQELNCSPILLMRCRSNRGSWSSCLLYVIALPPFRRWSIAANRVKSV